MEKHSSKILTLPALLGTFDFDSFGTMTYMLDCYILLCSGIIYVIISTCKTESVIRQNFTHLYYSHGKAGDSRQRQLIGVMTVTYSIVDMKFLRRWFTVYNETFLASTLLLMGCYCGTTCHYWDMLVK